MEDRFNEVGILTEIGNISLDYAMLKTLEEFGELSKEVNRVIGIKRRENLSEFEIRSNIKDELVDTIQNLFSVASILDIDYEEIVNHMKNKNDKWKLILDKKI